MKINNLDEIADKYGKPKIADLMSDISSAYDSPITLIAGQLETKIENDVMSTIQRYGIDVNKEELLKALNYDRQQFDAGYQKGFEAGYQKAKNELADMILRYPM